MENVKFASTELKSKEQATWKNVTFATTRTKSSENYLL